MEIELKIDKNLDDRVNSILYAFFNGYESDVSITDYHIQAFLMYIQNKMLNIRNGEKDIDKIGNDLGLDLINKQ